MRLFFIVTVTEPLHGLQYKVVCGIFNSDVLYINHETLGGVFCLSLTINALEVEKVRSVVHLVQLQTHFHQIARHWILSPYSQMVWVHHLQHISKNTSILDFPLA